MRKTLRAAWATALLAAPLASLATAADPPPPGQKPTASPVISSHQIDRYDAIKQIQDKLKDDSKSLADWVILGELAHEVALDLPADQAGKYNSMSLDAYEKALALAPDNPGLKAAVQFARDQQSNQNQFEKSRDQATQTYLDARRRDLSATNYTPSVRVTEPPMPSRTLPAAAPVVPGQPAVANATTPANAPTVGGPAPGYTTYTYRPLYSATATSPYTFQQYTSAYYPPNYYVPGTAPMSAQRYFQQSVSSPAGTQILRGVAPR